MSAGSGSAPCTSSRCAGSPCASWQRRPTAGRVYREALRAGVAGVNARDDGGLNCFVEDLRGRKSGSATPRPCGSHAPGGNSRQTDPSQPQQHGAPPTQKRSEPTRIGNGNIISGSEQVLEAPLQPSVRVEAHREHPVLCSVSESPRIALAAGCCKMNTAPIPIPLRS